MGAGEEEEEVPHRGEETKGLAISVAAEAEEATALPGAEGLETKAASVEEEEASVVEAGDKEEVSLIPGAETREEAGKRRSGVEAGEEEEDGEDRVAEEEVGEDRVDLEQQEDSVG